MIGRRGPTGSAVIVRKLVFGTASTSKIAAQLRMFQHECRGRSGGSSAACIDCATVIRRGWQLGG
jgi:hypothetical protein